MRRTRFMSLFFLVLAVSFLFLPEFRQGLFIPQLARSLDSSGDWSVAFSRQIAAITRDARQQQDPRILAFAALHAADAAESDRLASQAVSRDPSLTWIYYRMADRHHKTPYPAAWMAKLKAWDPENAVPHLWEAGQIFEAKKLSAYSSNKPEALAELAKQAEWREVMARAFAAPKYDNYLRQDFELHRNLMGRYGISDPFTVAFPLITYPIPNLLNLRSYSNLVLGKLGKEAEDAGRTQEAMNHYWSVARFTERILLDGTTLIEIFIAARLQEDSYGRLAPLLRKTGREQEAGTLEFVVLLRKQFIESTYRGKDPLSHSANYDWAALVVLVSIGLVYMFAVITFMCLVYVNAKRWVRPEKKGRLYQFFTTAENYMPILLFAACLALYVSYYPYARNFQYYMTATGRVTDFESLFYNTLPIPGLFYGHQGVPLGNPFVPYAWYALGGIALVVALALVTRRREPSGSET